MAEKSIVHLVNLRDFGGVERLILDYVINGKEHNWVIINTANSLNKRFNEHANSIIFCNRAIQSAAIQIPSFIRKKALWNKIKKINPSHVVIWNQIVSLEDKPDSIKAIYYDHGAVWEVEKNKKTIDFFKRIDGCICVSQASKKILENKFEHRCDISVILNRTSVESRDSIIADEKKKTFTIGCAARFSPLKALGLLPLIAEETALRGFNFNFIIAGTGEEESALASLIDKKNLKKSIKTIGFLDNLNDFYKHIDVYISTSAHETCSLSCIEAMSFGIPIISANIDGQPEIISNGHTGFCISPTLSMEDYCKKTGMSLPFQKDIYYPENDTIGPPRLLSPKDAADKIIEIYLHGVDDYKKNSRHRAKELFDDKTFEENLIKIVRNF
ncbi:glycosyltransferase [Edwardsiella piscicida]|uniref:Glycosyl transferase, group 1 n=4 Tax=Edwardsiella TaxID=635 RepID=A0A0H3DNT3_EDWTF|nr:glycosyltransferase [Edwardsiella piscicida]ACY82926.1 putative glycosyltransferase [Edwardsiella tarda EIB202]ADM40175.1 glycosyl transferase, group 1 [Edwardsiella tarda FL6-60]ARD18227.1 glycosyl transferase [Edwardsiella piscicida]EKS7767514.1 glycosyltransferase [Edwardsiella piscicida]EKS7781026.1 glycosyltransferase [Edwardsiella piscicida]